MSVEVNVIYNLVNRVSKEAERITKTLDKLEGSAKSLDDRLTDLEKSTGKELPDSMKNMRRSLEAQDRAIRAVSRDVGGLNQEFRILNRLFQDNSAGSRRFRSELDRTSGSLSGISREGRGVLNILNNLVTSSGSAGGGFRGASNSSRLLGNDLSSLGTRLRGANSDFTRLTNSARRFGGTQREVSRAFATVATFSFFRAGVTAALSMFQTLSLLAGVIPGVMTALGGLTQIIGSLGVAIGGAVGALGRLISGLGLLPGLLSAIGVGMVGMGVLTKTFITPAVEGEKKLKSLGNQIGKTESRLEKARKKAQKTREDQDVAGLVLARGENQGMFRARKPEQVVDEATSAADSLNSQLSQQQELLEKMPPRWQDIAKAVKGVQEAWRNLWFTDPQGLMIINSILTTATALTKVMSTPEVKRAALETAKAIRYVSVKLNQLMENELFLKQFADRFATAALIFRRLVDLAFPLGRYINYALMVTQKFTLRVIELSEAWLKNGDNFNRFKKTVTRFFSAEKFSSAVSALVKTLGSLIRGFQILEQKTGFITAFQDAVVDTAAAFEGWANGINETRGQKVVQGTYNIFKGIRAVLAGMAGGIASVLGDPQAVAITVEFLEQLGRGFLKLGEYMRYNIVNYGPKLIKFWTELGKLLDGKGAAITNALGRVTDMIIKFIPVLDQMMPDKLVEWILTFRLGLFALGLVAGQILQPVARLIGLFMGLGTGIASVATSVAALEAAGRGLKAVFSGGGRQGFMQAITQESFAGKVLTGNLKYGAETGMGGRTVTGLPLAPPHWPPYGKATHEAGTRHAWGTPLDPTHAGAVEADIASVSVNRAARGAYLRNFLRGEGGFIDFGFRRPNPVRAANKDARSKVKQARKAAKEARKAQKTEGKITYQLEAAQAELTKQNNARQKSLDMLQRSTKSSERAANLVEEGAQSIELANKLTRDRFGPDKPVKGLAKLERAIATAIEGSFNWMSGGAFERLRGGGDYPESVIDADEFAYTSKEKRSGLRKFRRGRRAQSRNVKDLSAMMLDYDRATQAAARSTEEVFDLQVALISAQESRSEAVSRARAAAQVAKSAQDQATAVKEISKIPVGTQMQLFDPPSAMKTSKALDEVAESVSRVAEGQLSLFDDIDTSPILSTDFLAADKVADPAKISKISQALDAIANSRFWRVLKFFAKAFFFVDLLIGAFQGLKDNTLGVRDTWNNFVNTIKTKFLPAVKDLFTALSGGPAGGVGILDILNAITKFAGSAALKSLIIVLDGVTQGLTLITKIVTGVVEVITAIINQIKDIFTPGNAYNFGENIGDGFKTILKGFGESLGLEFIATLAAYGLFRAGGLAALPVVGRQLTKAKETRDAAKLAGAGGTAATAAGAQGAGGLLKKLGPKTLAKGALVRAGAFLANPLVGGALMALTIYQIGEALIGASGGPSASDLKNMEQDLRERVIQINDLSAAEQAVLDQLTTEQYNILELDAKLHNKEAEATKALKRFKKAAKKLPQFSDEIFNLATTTKMSAEDIAKKVVGTGGAGSAEAARGKTAKELVDLARSYDDIKEKAEKLERELAKKSEKLGLTKDQIIDQVHRIAELESSMSEAALAEEHANKLEELAFGTGAQDAARRLAAARRRIGDATTYMENQARIEEIGVGRAARSGTQVGSIQSFSPLNAMGGGASGNEVSRLRRENRAIRNRYNQRTGGAAGAGAGAGGAPEALQTASEVEATAGYANTVAGRGAIMQFDKSSLTRFKTDLEDIRVAWISGFRGMGLQLVGFGTTVRNQFSLIRSEITSTLSDLTSALDTMEQELNGALQALNMPRVSFSSGGGAQSTGSSVGSVQNFSPLNALGNDSRTGTGIGASAIKNGKINNVGMLSELQDALEGPAKSLLSSIPGVKTIASVLRPGAMTSSGNVSQHSTGSAIDFTMSSKKEMADAGRWIQRNGGRFGVNPSQVFYPGRGANGPDHEDHVHVGFGGPGMSFDDLKTLSLTDPGQIGRGATGVIATAAGQAIFNAANRMLGGGFGFNTGGSAPAGPAGILEMISEAAAAYGANAAGLQRVAFAESSYNTGVVNTTDINARRGTPSRGLFQFIESTFAGFAPLARAANPAAWRGVPMMWTNPMAQALTAAWAFTNGRGGNWSTAGEYYGGSFGDGGDFIAKRPQLIQVGDKQPERVTVSPTRGPNKGKYSGGNTTVVHSTINLGTLIANEDGIEQLTEAIGKKFRDDLRTAFRNTTHEDM